VLRRQRAAYQALRLDSVLARRNGTRAVIRRRHRPTVVSWPSFMTPVGPRGGNDRGTASKRTWCPIGSCESVGWLMLLRRSRVEHQRCSTSRAGLARSPAACSVDSLRPAPSLWISDPVLLTIAGATFADDDRVRIVRADLRDPAWVDEVPERVDVVVTATALHWLPQEAVRRVYRDVAHVVRPGGVIAHAEEMPLVDQPRLGSGLAEVARERRSHQHADARVGWDAWWEKAARDPALRVATTERRAVFTTTYPTEEFSPPADWHIAALSEAGFTEVGVVWRSGAGAIVAAVR
jgi:SAM-dependent methyltransferase